MNAVDIAILVVLTALLAKGVWLGLIHELCALIGLGAGTFLAVRYHAPLAHALGAWAKLSPEGLGAICALLLFVVTLVVCVLLGMVLSRFVKLVFLGGFDRVLGGLFGLVQGVLLLALLLHGLTATNWLREPCRQSRLAPPFITLGGKILAGGTQLLP
jgi:membrane protein required for colicin V production